tara:strand:+ start:904 stop:1308 length:405 start_codon:yes stop_codon:yes gene_type:complete
MCKKCKKNDYQLITPLVCFVFLSQVFIIVRLFQITDYVSFITGEFESKITNMTSSMRQDFIYRASLISYEMKAYQENLDSRLDIFEKKVEKINYQLNLIINKINNTENTFKYSNLNDIDNQNESNINYPDLIPP